MVGKSNRLLDAELHPRLRGMANPTAGLNAFDQVREASMADEGGASGAFMEREEAIVDLTVFAVPIEPTWRERAVEWPMRNIAMVMACGLGVAFAGIALRRG